MEGGKEGGGRRRKSKIPTTQADSDVHWENRGFSLKSVSILTEQGCCRCCFLI